MNGDYKYLEVAQRIVDRIKKCKTEEACQITPDDLVELVGANSGLVNCYPGIPTNVCCREAFFISLTSGHYLSQLGRHLTFRQALEKFGQHMLKCKNTKVVVLIVDSWDLCAFSEWQPAIEQTMKDGVLIEAFLIAGNNITPVKL